MTPLCANCHGAPHTPEIREDLVEVPPCPAESRWPEWLRQGLPELQAQDYWVRSNFETTRASHIPLRIDLESAGIEASLHLHPRSRSFRPFPWSGSPYQALGVTVPQGAQLSAHLEVSHNAIPLGLRTLLETQGLFIDGPASINLWPERISVGEYGEVHAIARSTASALFFFDPFMVPRPPLGHDLPTGDQWDEVEHCLTQPDDHPFDGGRPCFTPVTYPNHHDNPRFDILLTDRIPAELRDPNGRLPRDYNLETLIARLLTWHQAHPADPNAAPDSRSPLERVRAALSQVRDWIQPGSGLTLNIGQLNDLFVSGLLDLGPSHGNFSVTYAGGLHVVAESRDLEINLDPIDYPATPGPERPGLQIEAANLTAAGASTELQGVEIPPGLRLDFDAEENILWAEANLELTFDGRLPGLGNVELSGVLVLRSGLRLGNHGLEPIPGATALEFRQGELWESGGARPILTQFTLSVDDLSRDPGGTGNIAHLGLSGWLGRDRHLDVQANLPLPTQSGAYDFSRLFLEESANLTAEILGETGIRAELRLSNLGSESEAARPGIHRALRLEGNLSELDNHGRSRPLLRDLLVDLQLDREGPEDGDRLQASFSATAFDRGPISLRGIGGRVEVDRLRFEDGLLEIRVPTFRISVNDKGSPRGVIRGPVDLELNPRSAETLRVLWARSDRRLEVHSLDLRFSAQGLRVLPPSLRRLLDPRVAALGIDGHLEGGFTMQFPEDRSHWHGRGELRLRGDRDGDIYLLDGRGRRVGLPLIRDTRWQWRRIDRIDWQRRYALGQFHLDTLLNFSALLPGGGARDPEAAPVYGRGGRRLLPYEIDGIMPYDNQPWDLSGFQNRIVDYLGRLCRQNPDCRSASEGGRRP